MKKLIKLFHLFFPTVVGGIVGFLISKSIDYTSLVQPPLAPPKILFPIAWTIIYLLMGVSFYLYKKKYGEGDKTLNVIYYVQLFVNALWSIIFFLWKLRLLAIFWIVGLDILVLSMIYLFYLRNRISAYLNFLYMAWISFATYLTIGIYVLN